MNNITQKIKIAFLVEHYPPTEGGLATSAQRISRELVSLGVDMHVFCFDSNIPLDSPDSTIQENDNGVMIYRIAPFFLKQPQDEDSFPEKVKSKFRRRAFNQIIAILKKDKVDCILSFYLLNSGYLGLLVARELKLPFIAGVRGNDIGKNIFHIERFGVIQWIVNGANKIVCVNEHLKNRLLLAFPEVGEKVDVFQNGVVSSDEVINKIKSRKKIMQLTGWKENDLILVFSGVLREKKGIVPLLHGIDLCDNHSVKLLIVGPEIRHDEKKLCGTIWDKLKARNTIYYTGNVSREDVRSWMFAGDVVVMPSLDDGMANGLLEGMALGLCPLVSDIFSDIVDNNKTGIVVQANNANNITHSINTLLENNHLVVEFGRQAKLTIEKNHQPRAEALKYLNLFKTLINTN